MKTPVSIAIETSCRRGGVALGRGERLIQATAFDATGRHATQLICHLEALLDRAGLGPTDLDEVYVSAGPGSFTGLRVGITAVRTLAQAVAGLRCVAVCTARVVAWGASELDWQNLGVVLDSRQGSVHVTLFSRRGGEIIQTSPGRTMEISRLMRDAPRPIMLVGEGLGRIELSGEGMEPAPLDWPCGHLPTVENVWRIGREMAGGGDFVDYNNLLPLYARRPEAVRLWEKRASRNAAISVSGER